MPTVSHWHATAQPRIRYRDLPATADLVVIGGGIIGVSSAYFASLAGLETVLIDQVALAYGATGRNGGFVGGGAADSYLNVRARYGAQTAQAIWRYSARNRALLHEVIARDPFDFDFRQPGTMNFALTEQDAAEMRANITAYEADGGPAGASVWLDHPQAQAHVDTPISEEIVGCAFMPDYALVHSAKLVYGLGAAAATRGAMFSIGTVHTVANAADGAHVRVSTYTGAIDARAVIIAGNAWTDELLPALRGVITPVRGQVLTYAPSERVFNTGMGASVTATGEYWQQTLDGRILIGGCRADAPDREWNIRADDLRADVQASLARVIPRLFPQLTDLHVDRRWSGPMAFTADYLPVIDAAPGLANVWVAGGFNGSGMGYGLMTGAALTEAVLRNARPESIAPFALARAGLTERRPPGADQGASISGVLTPTTGVTKPH
jgi:glycine/D-amino acid oxidase-like deaminating enzyme